MNKTISITIAGLVFNIEEDAYNTLHDYLESIKKHFAATAYGSEVYSDIEARVAEQFKKKTEETKIQVISRTDVDMITKTMGTVADFEPAEGNRSQEQPPKSAAKKLYRNPDDMIVAGVASGLAAYLGWDVLLVRILFVVTFLTGGWGFVLYLLLWLLVPLAETAGEKIEMRGNPVTLSQLEQTVKERLNEPNGLSKAKGARSRFMNLLAVFCRLCIRVVKALFLLAVSIGGAFTSIGAALAAFGITMLAVVLVFNPHSPYVDSNLIQIFPGSGYFLVLVAAYLTAVLPLVFVVLLGVMLVSKKNVFNKKAVGVIAILWLLAAFTSGAMFFRAAPKIEEIANAPVETSSRALQFSDFEKIKASGDFDIKVTPGNNYAVTLTGNEEEMDKIVAKMTDKTLDVARQDRFRICFFCFGRSMALEVTMPTLSSVTLSGSSTVVASGIKSDNFELRLSGASRATLSGQADKLTASLSGGSRINAGELTVRTADVKASGGSTAYINVAESLTGKASGGSNIYHSGAATADIETSGGADVERFE